MTITRLWQAGAELNFIDELAGFPNDDYSFGSIEMTVSSTKAKRGTRSFRTTDNARPRGAAFSATQIRASFFINHNSLDAAGDAGVLAIIRCSLATESILYWDYDTDTLRLRVNNTVEDSIDVAVAGFATVDTWYHIGITYLADGSSGFFSVYLDGIQILTFTGNTGTSISGFYLGGHLASNKGWDNYTYFDDITIDDASGEADAPVPSVEYLWSIANGAGASTNLTPNTGANYAAVDDVTPDGDTTYVYGDADGEKDSYETADVTIPAGYGIVAKIPTALARKTDAGTDSKFRLGTRTTGGVENLGSGQSLPTGYGVIFERQTTDPDTAAWTQTTINNSQVVIEADGTF